MGRGTRLALAVAAVAVSPASASAQGTWNLAVEAGSEYDSNIHRVQTPGDIVGEPNCPPVVGAPLARGGARLRMGWRRGRQHQLRFAGFGGGKVFLTGDALSENVAVAMGDGDYQWRHEGLKLVLGLRGHYYDAFIQRPLTCLPPGGTYVTTNRTFSTLQGETFLTLLGPANRLLTAYAGYQRFRYKPDADFHWDGDRYGIEYRQTTWLGDAAEDADTSALELSIAYAVTRRAYWGLAFSNACRANEPPTPGCLSVPTDFQRHDLFHSGVLGISLTTDRVWSARYSVQAVDSNSSGQSLVRQRLELGVTTQTWQDLFLTAKANVQLNSFLDPLLLARDVQAQTFISIDEENRNSLSVHLSRDISQRLALEGRYVLFANEFARQSYHFRRQTLYLGALYTY